MASGQQISQAQPIKDLYLSRTSRVQLVRLPNSQVVVLKHRQAEREKFLQEVEIYRALVHSCNLFPKVLDVDVQGGRMLLSVCGFISAAKYMETCSDAWDPASAELMTLGILRLLHRMHSVGIVHGDIRPHHVLLVSKLDPRLSGFSHSHRMKTPSAIRLDIKQLGKTLVRVFMENCDLRVETSCMSGLLTGFTGRLRLLLTKMLDMHGHASLTCENLISELGSYDIPQPVHIVNNHDLEDGFEIGALTKEVTMLATQQPFSETAIRALLPQIHSTVQRLHCVCKINLEEGLKSCQGRCGRRLQNLQELLCTHRFCNDCLEEQLLTSVQNKVNFAYIACAVCRQAFDPMTLQLPTWLFAALDSLQIEQKYCHCPRCKTILENEYTASPQNLKCPNCSYVFCSYCRGKRHYFRCGRFATDAKK